MIVNDNNTLRSMVAPTINTNPISSPYTKPTIRSGQSDDNWGVANNTNGVGRSVSVDNTTPTTPEDYTQYKIQNGMPTTNYSAEPSPTRLSQMVAPAPIRDNSSLISQQYDQASASAIAQLRAMIAKNISDQNAIKEGAPAQFYDSKNQAEAGRTSNMQSLREMLANAGQQGGVNRTEETQVNANADNIRASIQSQQDRVISEANKAIADLQASGNFKEAQIVADNAQAKIAALIDESNRVESVGYSRLRDQIGDNRYSDETAYNRNQDSFNNNLRLSDYTGNITDSNGNVIRTMAGQSNDLNNQLTRLGIDTVKLNLAALPQQIQDQAKLLTQQITSGQINIDTGKAQLKELTDPNSITNKLARLNLDTSQFNYNQLDTEAKQQADKVAADLAASNISTQMAKFQLDNLKNGLNADGSARTVKTDTNSNNTIEDYASVIQKYYYTAPNKANDYAPKIDYSGIKSYLQQLQQQGVSDSLLSQLAQRYGIIVGK